MHRHSLVLVPLFLFAGCASDPSVAGRYVGSGIAPLPNPPLPMEDLSADATLVLAEDGTFELDLALAVEALGLTDVMNVRGTYVAAGGMLTLEPTGYEIPEGSLNTTAAGPNGEPCIVLAGFLDTPVCLPAAQTRPYTLAGDALSITIEDNVAGIDGTMDLDLTRAP